MLKWFKRIKKTKNSYDFYAIVCDYKKSFIAKILDLSFLCIIVVLPIFLILPLFFSITLLVMLIILFYMSFKKGYMKLKALTYNKILSEEIERQLDHILLDDFRSLLIKLLLENNIFSGIVVGKNMIEGTVHDIRYAIGYDIVCSQETTNWETVEAFISSVQNQDYENIIFFTNTKFEERCHSLKRSFQDLTIYLIEREYIIKVLMDSTLAPSNSELEKIVGKKYDYMERITKTKKYNIIPTKGAKSLFVYSFMFILLAFLSEKYLIYYLVVSAIFFILAIIMSLLNKEKPKKSDDILDITKEVGL